MAEDTQTVAPPQYIPSADETGALEALKTGPMKSVADPFQRLYTQSQQASFENETAKRKQAETLAKGKSDAVQTMYTGMQSRMAEMDKMAPPPKMNITPDTHEGLMGLATILPIAGLLLGSKGMTSGVNAMNAMTGAMKGYQEGNQARIEFEKQKYDRSMKEWDANYKISRQKLADAIEMMKTNYQAGVAKAETAAVAMGPEPAAIVRQNGAAFLLSKLDEANKHVLAAQEKLSQVAPTPVIDTQTGKSTFATRAQISENPERYQPIPKGAAGGSSLVKSFQQQVDLAINEAAYQTSLLKDLPVATSGVFGMRGKPTSLFQAPLEALANGLTKESTQRYNDIMMTMGREAAKVMGGGRQVTDTAANQWARQFTIAEGDKGFTALQRLAMLRGTFERGLEVLRAQPNTTPEILAIYDRAQKEFATAIPITAKDVQNAQDEQMRSKGKSQKKFSDLMQSALPSEERRAQPLAAPAQSEPSAPAAAKQKANPGEQVHQDAQGNKAVQRNGTWVEVE